MSYVEDRKDEVIDEIRELVRLEEDETWDDPYSLLESIQNKLDELNFTHDKESPLGEPHQCTIWVRSCETWRDCYCNATNGRDHSEYEATLIGPDGKHY